MEALSVRSSLSRYALAYYVAICCPCFLIVIMLQVRNGRQGVYFKERMRRGETIVSFPRNLRLDEKTAMKV